MAKSPPINARDMGLISVSGRSSGEGNGNPLQYSCLGNPIDRGAGRLRPIGSQKSQTGLSDWRTTEKCLGLAPYSSPCHPWGSASPRSCLGSGILYPQHRRTNQNVFLTRSQVIHIHADTRGIAVGQGPWNVNVPESPWRAWQTTGRPPALVHIQQVWGGTRECAPVLGAAVCLSGDLPWRTLDQPWGGHRVPAAIASFVYFTLSHVIFLLILFFCPSPTSQWTS